MANHNYHNLNRRKAEIVAPILAFTYYPEIEEFMNDRFTSYNISSMNPEHKMNVEFIDQLQSGLQCCGWDDKEVYGNSIPPSCCEEFNRESLEDRLQNPIQCSSKAYKEGCEVKMNVADF